MKKDNISRRTFLKTGIAVGTGLCGLSFLSSFERQRPLKVWKRNRLKKGLVVVHGNVHERSGERSVIKEMVNRGIRAIGGMDKLVSRGDNVVIKPNIAWDRYPEYAANTNPFVVAALAGLCIEAGANRVKVLDHTCAENPGPSYLNSGIEKAAKEVGADVRFVSKNLFKDIKIAGGKVLDSWPFYEKLIYQDKVDVLINVPIAKHHSASLLSMALKNTMGMIGGNRGSIHKDIHPKIADLNRVVKVDLTVLDAFRILKHHGPTGGRLGDVDNTFENARRLVFCVDPVAVDSYGATLFGYQGREIGFIRESYEAGLGEIDYTLNGFEEITV
ncbi:hypothetical protein SCALIN_C29_0075 [Candidatus Scalindua japonica]|uniref:DUF362 domain-containing protein n=1 Tax=Candidatus Scalindua japonica TaxID=1284222 RepID=A0A286U2K0_9BACT|nr:DUF362 domain-containing protein [Candidatus Scalindua japonica]GAX62291.1 hypothetical protein SCALIN_C29_0075 [Candidatus Scalindua japonica]